MSSKRKASQTSAGNYSPLWLSCRTFVEAAADESVVVASCKTLSDVAGKTAM